MYTPRPEGNSIPFANLTGRIEGIFFWQELAYFMPLFYNFTNFVFD